jgi:hypothetical protein
MLPYDPRKSPPRPPTGTPPGPILLCALPAPPAPRRHILSLAPPCGHSQAGSMPPLPATLLLSSPTKTKAISFPFKRLRTLLRKHRDATRSHWSLAAIFFRISTYGQSPRFSRNRPKSSSRNLFRISTYKKSRCNPFRIRTYEKTGGRGNHMLTTTGSTGFSLCSDDYGPQSRATIAIGVRPRVPGGHRSLPPYLSRHYFHSSHQFFQFSPTLFRFDAPSTPAIRLLTHGQPLYALGFVPQSSFIFRGDSCPPNCVIFSRSLMTSSSNSTSKPRKSATSASPSAKSRKNVSNI